MGGVTVAAHMALTSRYTRPGSSVQRGGAKQQHPLLLVKHVGDCRRIVVKRGDGIVGHNP